MTPAAATTTTTPLTMLNMGSGVSGGSDGKSAAAAVGLKSGSSCRKNLVNASVKSNNSRSFGMNSNNWLVKFTKRSY